MPMGSEARVNSKSTTPMVLFAFRRPKETQLVFDRIREIRPAKLYLICDGPRPQVAGESDLVADVRRIIDSVDWPCEVFRDFSEINLGLRDRIMTGLDFVFEREESAIILEDDCLPGPDFAPFASELLDRYQAQTEVGMISGHNFAPYSAVADYHFSKSPYIWGWATWARVWRAFRSSPQVEEWPQDEITKVLSTFASMGQAKSFEAMMREARSLNTWDVSLAVWFRQQGLLAAVPKENLVRNIGFGAGATHTKFESFDVDEPIGRLEFPLAHPSRVVPDSVRERKMWRSRQLKWLTFPIQHPIELLRRFWRYAANRWVQN